MLKIAYHSIYAHPLPKGHRFPMEKYDLLPQQLLHEGTCNASHFFKPKMARIHLVEAVHAKSYIDNLNTLKLDKNLFAK